MRDSLFSSMANVNLESLYLCEHYTLQCHVQITPTKPIQSFHVFPWQLYRISFHILEEFELLSSNAVLLLLCSILPIQSAYQVKCCVPPVHPTFLLPKRTNINSLTTTLFVLPLWAGNLQCKDLNHNQFCFCLLFLPANCKQLVLELIAHDSRF